MFYKTILCGKVLKKWRNFRQNLWEHCLGKAKEECESERGEKGEGQYLPPY